MAFATCETLRVSTDSGEAFGRDAKDEIAPINRKFFKERR